MMMLSKTLSVASAAILIMLAMVYYSDDSSLALAILLVLAVTNEYAMEIMVISMSGLVLVAIIRIHIDCAVSVDEFSIPSGNLGGMSTPRISHKRRAPTMTSNSSILRSTRPRHSRN
eukprot:scaffold395910_cov59-Attheya_sp.AAC.1